MWEAFGRIWLLPLLGAMRNPGAAEIVRVGLTLLPLLGAMRNTFPTVRRSV